jgi:N-acetylglucosaminyl-diphospho-decaprenol L-rhamnosyltransferase
LSAAPLDRVTVVTVTYDSEHCLPALARALAACPHVVVVDNGSADRSAAEAERLLPQATVLRLGENLGYGAANNRGIATAATPYVLLLNPDVDTSATAIAALVEAAEAHPEAALWVPQLTGRNGEPELNYAWPRSTGEPQGGAAEGPLCVGYACAAALLMDRARMEAIGFFDTRFFLYYEDEDLCLRAFNARLPVVVVPQVRMGHYGRGSTRGPRPLAAEYWRGWHHAQSKIRFAAKHHGASAAYQLWSRTRRNALATVALRALLLSPRHLARAWGRLRGLSALRAEVAHG